MEEQFTTRADIHYEEKLSAALKGPVKLNQEWVIKLFENASLTQNRFDLIVINELVFSKDLDRVQTPSVLLPSEDHSAETASTDNSHLLKVVNSDILA